MVSAGASAGRCCRLGMGWRPSEGSELRRLLSARQAARGEQRREPYFMNSRSNTLNEVQSTTYCRYRKSME